MNLTSIQEDFPQFNQALRACFGAVQGSAGAPLLYVLRDEANVPDAHINGDVGPGGTFESWDDYLIECTTHNSNEFKEDNNKAYNTIYSLLQVKKGDASDTEIKHFYSDTHSDGHGAYFHLRTMGMVTTHRQQILKKMQT